MRQVFVMVQLMIYSHVHNNFFNTLETRWINKVVELEQRFNETVNGFKKSVRNIKKFISKKKFFLGSNPAKAQ